MTGPTPSAVPDASRWRRFCAGARRQPLFTAACALVTLALVVRLGGGWHAHRRLAVALGEVRGRGEPLTAADFAGDDLPPSDNAWTRYAEAARVVAASAATSPRQSNVEYAPYAPRGQQWEALASTSEKGDAAAFPLARQARRLRRLQFPSGRSLSPGFRREWTEARELANTLADGAEYAHLRGDDAEAVERLLDTLHLGRLVRQDAGIISQLVGIGISALALDAVQQVGPTLALGSSATGTAATGTAAAGTAAAGTPASTAQARALLAALLDESRPREWFVRSLHWERAVHLDDLNRDAAEVWAIRPAATATAARSIEGFHAVIQSARQDNGRGARKTLRPLYETAEGIDLFVPFGGSGRAGRVPRYSRWFEELVGSRPAGVARSLEQFHRESAERRMTAVMLAARLYRHDHGRWPDDAAALVPRYLDGVPADPFREDGGPLGYVVLRGALPDGGDRPLVYSDAGDVGSNPQGAIGTEPMYGWQQDSHRAPGRPRRETRQYRDVSLWQPKTRRWDEARKRQEEFERELAAEAVDDDPQKPDAPGDDAEDDRGPDGPAEQ